MAHAHPGCGLIPEELLTVFENLSRVCPHISSHTGGILKQHITRLGEEYGHAIGKRLSIFESIVVVGCQSTVRIGPDLILKAFFFGPRLCGTGRLKTYSYDRDT
jgi:hypothetical protein